MTTQTKKISKSATAKVNMQDVFLQEILSKIEAVNPEDWEHFAKDKLFLQNAFTGYKYRRLNRFILMLDTLINKRESKHYATFKQISQNGGVLKKGSKGILIEFFSWMIKHKEKGNNISIADFRLLAKEEKQKYAVLPISKFYRVFNMDDVDTSNMKIKETVEDEMQEIDIDLEITVSEFIDNIKTKHGLVLLESKDERAYYSPSKDIISIPPLDNIKTQDIYYSVLFHEIIHWTGAKDRLNRPMGARFGSEEYSFEELVAELGSMLLCFEYDITSTFINSLRYLKGWSCATTENREAEFKKAFIGSQTAINFLK